MAELSCALPICPRRRRRREQIVGADKIACITSHFVPIIQAILQLNSAISGKKRAISWNEIAHYVCTLLYSLQFVVARQLRILKSKKRAVFLNFSDISHMREKMPNIPDIRDVFEKKGSDLKSKQKKMLRCKYAVH